MEILIIFLYFCFFSWLAWKNFRLALIFFIILLPSYLIRFKIGPFPSTVLELTFGSLFFVWLVKYSRQDWKKIWAISKKHVWFFVALDLFFVASVVSIFVSDMWWFSLGEWRAYFLEPMIFFLILLGRSSSPSYQEGVGGVAGSVIVQAASLTPTPPKRGILTAADLIWALAFSTLSISIYAIIQKFTGWGIATPQWAEESGRRVTAFFTSPNAVGLYLAPVLMLTVSVIASTPRGINSAKQSHGTVERTEGLPRRPAIAGLLAMTIFAVLAIIFTKSQGALIGLGAGILVFLFFSGYKKIAAAVAILAIIVALAVPSMRQAVLFQDTANQNRLRLWGYTQIFLTQSPKNFVLGTGVRQFFRKAQKPYYDKIVMERLIYPHNFFLNFWTEVGLIGMLAMMTILGYSFFLAYRIGRQNKIISAGLFGALTVLLIHGLVDVPYFKNDLAFLFWVIIVLPFYFDPIVRATVSHSPTPLKRGIENPSCKEGEGGVSCRPARSALQSEAGGEHNRFIIS